MSSNLPAPAHLAARPAAGGLVVPWITPWSHDKPLFGQITDVAQWKSLLNRLCQVCGEQLPDRAVLFARASDLRHQCVSEPATCPACAAYSRMACPMLSGRLASYRSGEHPSLAGIPADFEQLLRRGAPAERWLMVWVQAYDVIDHPAKPGSPAASWHRIPPLRIRPVPSRS
jgi:hypothetical protein